MDEKGMNLAEKALAMKFNVQRQLATPVARLLPAGVSELLMLQAGLIAEMARELHEIRNLMDMGAE